MEVKEAILHRPIKEPKQAKHAEVDYREERLEINDILINLTKEVVKIYSRVSNGYGTFDTDDNLHPFPPLALKYLGDEEDFVPFSKKTAALIADKMKTEAFASGGYLLLVRYEAGNSDWIIAAMLKLKPGTAVNEDTKELLENLRLDVDHLHEAARINIHKWIENEQPYLSFVKKRAGKEDITRYFRSALGCTDYTHSKHHTEQAMDAIKKFMLEKEWDPKKKNKIKQKVYDYFTEKNKNDEPVNLISLSGLIDDQNPEEFTAFVKENDYSINETFDPHPRTYRSFKRITGKIGSINLSLDVADIVSGKVKYEEQTGNIVITKTEDTQLAESIREHQDADTD